MSRTAVCLNIQTTSGVPVCLCFPSHLGDKGELSKTFGSLFVTPLVAVHFKNTAKGPKPSISQATGNLVLFVHPYTGYKHLAVNWPPWKIGNTSIHMKDVPIGTFEGQRKVKGTAAIGWLWRSALKWPLQGMEKRVKQLALETGRKSQKEMRRIRWYWKQWYRMIGIMIHDRNSMKFDIFRYHHEEQHETTAMEWEVTPETCPC